MNIKSTLSVTYSVLVILVNDNEHQHLIFGQARRINDDPQNCIVSYLHYFTSPLSQSVCK